MPSVSVVDTLLPLIDTLSIASEVKPAISVVVAPSVNVDEPNVIVEFAKLAFVIPAVPERLVFVNPEIVF